MGQKHLRGAAYVPNWSSLAGAIEGVTRAFGLALDTLDVMGLSGLAFTLRLPAEGGVPLAGRAMPEPADLEGFRRLGIEWALHHAEGDASATRDAAHREARRAVDGGSPAVAFGLFVPEFGLVTGYDDKSGTFDVSTQLDEQGRTALPYARWPLPERPGPVCVVRATKRVKAPRREAMAAAVGATPRLIDEAGAAFEAWAGAMESAPAISAPGNAYQVQVTQTSRFKAAGFLERAGAELAVDLGGAARAYRAGGIELSRLGTLFPYPNGGDLSDEFLRGQASRMLRAAAAHEREAGEILRAAGFGR